MDLVLPQIVKGIFYVVACALVAIIVLGVLRGILLRSIFAGWRRNAPTPEMKAFEYRLRDLIFRDPALFMTRLQCPDGLGFVASLWKECGWVVPKDKLPPDHPGAPDLHRFHLPDGRAIAVVKMPESRKALDPVLLGIVLPEDASLTRDLVRARRLVHFFVLYGPGYGRDSDLCEWPIKGRKLTYNVGAPRDPEGFARVVGNKLAELRR